LVEDLKGGQGTDRLLLVEHEPVLTLGRRTQESHVLAGRDVLQAKGIAVHEVERAGDVTYHGPGQLVVYPVIDLHRFRKDVRWFSCRLLTAVQAVVESYGIETHLRFGRETGVWTGPESAARGKIAALGVRIERWITFHGAALNVSTDLAHFDLIVPCGLGGVNVVSVESELGRPVEYAGAKDRLLSSFAAAFDVDLKEDLKLSELQAVAAIGAES
jgi:lipoyl(octanoyl) transferase